MNRPPLKLVPREESPSEATSARYDKIKWMLKIAIEGAWEHCTEWEQNFLESCEKQFARKGDLSDKQMDVLERIYDKAE